MGGRDNGMCRALKSAGSIRLANAAGAHRARHTPTLPDRDKQGPKHFSHRSTLTPPPSRTPTRISGCPTALPPQQAAIDLSSYSLLHVSVDTFRI